MHPSQKQALKRQLKELNEAIDKARDAVVELAESQNQDPFKMVYANGHLVMPPLLLAKAECLSATVKLSE